jgi:pilus assembly protein CpaD
MVMIKRNACALAAAIALSIGLSACTSPKTANRSLDSVNQPVIEHHNMALDVATSSAGLPIGERRRLNDWFETMNLRYGDRIALDGPVAGAARDDVAAIAGHYGLLLSDGAPITQGPIEPGTIRVVVTRSTASVPNCPNWSGQFNSTLGNDTSPGYGCTINGNLAAMIADPDHLLHGATGTGETVIMSSTKAIQTYRETAPTGGKGLPSVSSKGG